MQVNSRQGRLMVSVMAVIVALSLTTVACAQGYGDGAADDDGGGDIRFNIPLAVGLDDEESAWRIEVAGERWMADVVYSDEARFGELFGLEAGYDFGGSGGAFTPGVIGGGVYSLDRTSETETGLWLGTSRHEFSPDGPSASMRYYLEGPFDGVWGMIVIPIGSM